MKQRAGKKRPLQSRSAENLRPQPFTSSAGSGRSELKSQMTGGGGVGKSRSAPELVSESLREREPHSPPRDPGKRYATRRAPPGRAGSAPPLTSVERPLSEEERERTVEGMHREFCGRRKAVLNGLPPGTKEEDIDTFLEEYACRTVSKLKDRSVRVLFPSSEAASEHLQRLSSARYDGCKLSASYGHPDSLLFVGNLSSSFSREELLQLFKPHGRVLRCFVVCSPSSGLGKGYGFVEYSTRDEAAQAKLALATKVVGQRSLRVDFADNGMQTCEDLQSRTLFVDRLLKSFVDDDIIRDKFSTCGIVNFCQVALTANGVSRGFAFVDMSTWQEAELAQERCNGAVLSGQEMRVSFGMPCRPGACILQHKNSISIPFLNGRPVGGSGLQLCHKENIPLGGGRGDFCPHPTSLHFSLLPPMTSVPCIPHPFQLDATKPEFFPDPSFVPCGPLPLTSSNKIVHSYSSPDVISPAPCLAPPLSPRITTSLSSTSLPPHDTDRDTTLSRLSRKRCASALDSAVEAGMMAVYDRPYIGQHQQGIPFTHPLKRMKTFE
jgi:hypothetical protein